MRARGALLDESFSVKVTAGGLEALLLEESWPITLSAAGSGAVLDISGPLMVHGNKATRLHVGLYGKRNREEQCLSPGYYASELSTRESADRKPSRGAGMEL